MLVHTVKTGVGKPTWWDYYYPEVDATHNAHQYTYGLPAEREIEKTVLTNTLTTAVVGNGTISPADGSRFLANSSINLQATPDTGWSFNSWSGDAAGSDNPTTLIMDANKSVTATFTINTYTLTVNTAHGSVAKNPDQPTYDHGTSVKLTATPESGYRLKNWTLGATVLGTANPLTVTMDADKTITANFIKRTTSGGGGGGGGGAATSYRVILSGLNSPGLIYVNTSGMISGESLVTSLDSACTIKISAGTKMLNKDKGALTSLTAEVLAAPPAPPSGTALVISYNLGPEGATFDPALTITLSYDPAKLPKDVAEKGLFIARYDGTKWQALPSTVNDQANTVSASLTGFSQYALMGQVIPPAPAPSPTPSPSPSVTPTPKPTPTVTPTATPTPSAPAITTPAPTQTPAPSSAPPATTPQPAPGALNWPLIVGIVVVVLAIIVGSVLVIRRRRSGPD